MDKLIAARRPYRSCLTKVYNELNELLESDHVDELLVNVKLQILDKHFSKVDELSQQLMDFMLEMKIDEGQQDAELASISEYEGKYRYLKLKAEKFLESNLDIKRAHSVISEESIKTAGLQNLMRKYPKIVLKKFDGDLKEYLGFWAQFKHVHEDEQIPLSDKFQYLVQSMVKGSKAQLLVESYPQSEENYDKAIDALKRRFGREDLLVEVYVRELLKLVINNAKGEVAKLNLGNMYDTLESHLRSLESLGVTSEKYAALLFPLVESSLPEDILRAWQRGVTPSSNLEDTTQNRLSCLMKFLQSEVENEERIALAKGGFGTNKPKECQKRQIFSENHDMYTAAGLHVGNDKIEKKCVFCEGSHESDRCLKAQNMTLSEKKAKIQKKRCCYVCLNTGHMARYCGVLVKCVLCSKKHYTIICPQLTSQKENSEQRKSLGVEKPESSKVIEPSVTMTYQSAVNQVLLQTVMVNIVGRYRKQTVRLIFDSGAQRTYIESDCAKSLNLNVIGKELLEQIVFGGVKSKPVQHELFELNLEGLDGRNRKTITALSQNVICGSIPKLQKGPWLNELAGKGIWINDMAHDKSEIQILIGADYYGALMTGQSIRLENSGLTAFETVFGWTIMGLASTNESSETGVAMLVTNLQIQEEPIANFWDLELIGILDPIDKRVKSEVQALSKEYFRKTVCTDNEGRYEVKLPWIVDKSLVPNNRHVAEKRLNSTTCKLKSMGRVECYSKVIKEWLDEGIIEMVPLTELQLSCHFLPHRPVFKETSLTTPVRPVFDASAKQKGALSLNDCLEKGLNLLELIPSIILRFRQRKIGVIADIKKAFLMISVSPEDRDYLRFLWWESTNMEKLVEYRHKRVVFGVNCSPYLLAATLEYHLDNAPEHFKHTASVLKRSLYVDNCVTSVENCDSLEKFRKESVELLGCAKFDLRLWESTEVTDCRTFEFNNQISMLTDNRYVSNVLGLNWDRCLDTLSCKFSNLEYRERLTKREILSIVQRVYDPMGFVCPATLIPKLLLQETWALKIGWDQVLPENIEKEFKGWCFQQRLLAGINIPRWMVQETNREDSYSLHVFCDASQRAYASVAFLRSDSDNGYVLQLLQAKARVAPLNKATIPRLELLACLIGTRMANSIKTALDMPNLRTTYWSDSLTAIAWIAGKGEWGTFVANRVSEIRLSTKPEEWRHVPGTSNPADLPSRGCCPSKLLQSRWWEGPLWLKLEESQWPVKVQIEDAELNLEEVTKELKKTAVMINVEELAWYAKLVSSYSRMVRIIGWMLRFIRKARLLDKEKGQLSVNELKFAETVVFKLIQEDLRNGSQLCKLETRIDSQGIIRAETKIARRRDTFDFRYPIVLPAKHAIVESMIREKHVSSCHAGAQTIMTMLRERFWILQARKVIKKVCDACKRCRRYRVQQCETQPAVLPENRVKDALVFQITGVDLAGPLFLKDGSKSWVVLFTCAVYRAVHLELITALSTEAFMQALRRFIARRGRPATIYSDNGTNFTGTESALRGLNWDHLKAKFTTEKIEWIFNPPTASWWGGWWERIVRIMKDLLRRVLGKSRVYYEEMTTILCDVESVINQRPLTYVSGDIRDLRALTPAMFLQSMTNASVSDLDVIENDGFGKRFRYRQRLRDNLRSRFRKEYLSQLVQRAYDQKGPRLSVGDVVLIGTDDRKRVDWPMARVEELYPGKDGCARVARLKTSCNELIRPVKRLYLLEASPCQFQDSDKVVQVDVKPEIQVLADKARCNTRSGRAVKIPQRFK